MAAVATDTECRLRQAQAALAEQEQVCSAICELNVPRQLPRQLPVTSRQL